MNSKATPKLEYRNGRPSVLRKATVWRELNFYKRSEILYQLTVAFCRRFLPKHGDRTVDQMVQAARSTKQNIVEGYSDARSPLKSNSSFWAWRADRTRNCSPTTATISPRMDLPNGKTRIRVSRLCTDFAESGPTSPPSSHTLRNGRTMKWQIAQSAWRT